MANFSYSKSSTAGAYDGRFIVITNTDIVTDLNTPGLTAFAELFGISGPHDAALFTPNLALGTVTVLENGLYSLSGYAQLIRGTVVRGTLEISLSLNAVQVSPGFRGNYLRGLGGANLSGQEIPYFQSTLTAGDIVGVVKRGVGGVGTFFLDGTDNYFRMTKLL